MKTPFLAAFLCVGWLSGWAASASLQPSDLRCEYLKNPLGIDAPRPRLGWVLKPVREDARGLRQTAFQVMAATSLEKLQASRADLWDSGKVVTDLSQHVRYGGKALRSGEQCFWRVRVWDQNGRQSNWSDPAQWSMGLLSQQDWKAKWIGLDGRETRTLLENTSWVWHPEGNPVVSAPVGSRHFRRAFVIAQGAFIKKARLLLTADNEFVLHVNGRQAGTGSDFHSAAEFDLSDSIHSGTNVIAVLAKNAGTDPNPAGVAGLLRVEFERGEPLQIATDRLWKTSKEEAAGWEQPGFDDSAWTAAQVLGPTGMAPWGAVGGPEDRRLPARWVRKEFEVTKHVRRATVHVCGLGLFELHLNGHKVGDHVLSPGLTEYAKRAFYATFDLTDLLSTGRNAIGVVLGNGRYFAPRSSVPTDTRGYGFPKLLLQLRIEYSDGTRGLVVSDRDWKLTTEGPILANNEYDGEEYDARLELDGWSRVGYDDSKWQTPELTTGPAGVLAAQMIEPIRVIEVLSPLTVRNPQEGVYVFDMGQNMVGWCRLKVSGPAGTTVTLRHSETLKPDGTLYLDNIRSAKVTDKYILKGKGEEAYEPRFTYHGFRFVEVKGYPGAPPLTAIQGCVIHDAVESAGDFSCSNPLLNRIYQNARWGVRGNYRSIPTDCPQRDERQGWLGDRSAESKGETYLFNVAALYAKWVRDFEDAQKDSGSIPDVAPSYWPIYSDNVTWPGSTVIIPGSLYDQYADRDLVEGHYPSMVKWIDFMSRFLENDLMLRDTYGDWCVPPEDPKLIHSQDPARKTSPVVLGTCYFYHCLVLMNRYANLLGKSRDAERFAAMAEKLKTAFNNKFLKAEAGYYDNGSQTSCVLPLAFGLAPEQHRGRIFRHLVNKIATESKDHIGTGLVGGQWLMRTLSDNGRADLAYTLATQTTYPSWGYMIEKGATTMWELWNGDTADPAMNSGNHVMLVGDLVIWMHEYLAGIGPNPNQPGFKHIIMRPHPVGDLRSAAATYRAAYGRIVSAWKRDGARFTWNVEIPPNTTATLHVPAKKMEDVTESGKPAAKRAGLKYLGLSDGRAIFQLESGKYTFVSNW